MEEGVRDPLVIWEKGGERILIDGHNRYGIIQKHNIASYKVEKKNFDSIEEAKDWMINLQLGRRNLTKEQTSYLRGLQHEREKKKTTDTLKVGANSPLPQNEGTGATAEKLAGQHKVSRATIERDAQYAKGLEALAEQAPEVKSQILSGALKVKKSDIQAIGSGKKTAESILRDIKPVEAAKEENGAINESSNSESLDTIKMPVREGFLTKELSDRGNPQSEHSTR